jgi:hypothetical protein
MTTNRERELKTLGFQKPDGRGSVEETFYPWVLTTQRFKEEGMPADIADGAKDITNDIVGNKANQTEKYLPVSWGEGVMDYEKYLGFDPVRRIHFVLPFRRFDEIILEETAAHTIKQDIFGRQTIRKAGSDLDLDYKPVIETPEDWAKLKAHARKELDDFYSDAQLEQAYGHLAAAHERGDYSIRLNIEGFFWVPRELLGIEEHMFAFYDSPELLHDIGEFILEVYSRELITVVDLVQPDVLYFMEDLSGKTGPMISKDCFDEFVGGYYKRLIPLLKSHGVANVFVDTDGDFKQLIPDFMDAGVDGFLPMDVSAGMDIVEIRRLFPSLRFIGGYNKLLIAEGVEAIDLEFDRILPVIRSGGYIPGGDHQIAPSTSLSNYQYYIRRLHEVMEQAGVDVL